MVVFYFFCYLIWEMACHNSFVCKRLHKSETSPFVSLNKRSFTLIELLVVIVIIGLLAGLLMSVAGRAREATRRAQCANNLRQHGIAWYLYLDDHNDFFPKSGWPVEGGTFPPYFGGKTGVVAADFTAAEDRVLNRYLDIYDDSSPNVEIFHCPDDTKPNPRVGEDSIATYFDNYGNSYFLNDRFILYGAVGRPLSTITSPRNKVYLEFCTPGAVPGHGRGSVWYKARIMVLFVDGHVAGPFLYNEDFELWNPNTTKPVLIDPNGTDEGYD